MAIVSSLKRRLIGDPRASGELTEQVVPPWLGLPVFASDTLSSAAYATEETMIVLAVAGTAAVSTVWPIAALVGLLIVVVIAGYRQTIRAYPDGGGAYRVARTNLGEGAGLSAAAALLIDYTLTVAVSVAAGTAAVVSAFPQLTSARLVIALTFVGVITVINLRGVRDVSVPVAVLVYGFLIVMVAMIARGLVQCVQGCATVPFDQPAVAEVGTGLTALVVLRAFATASTSLTGVEAVSNGVGVFRPPAAANAAKTLGVIGAIAVPLLGGIAYLATRIDGVVAVDGLERTVTSQIAAAVFGADSSGFFAVQVATAAILFLAANTAYADFPRLASALAADQYLPRQLARRGDRLVFSNGILALSAAAAVLVAAAGARVTDLVGLYIVGVFTAFSLSQAGMVRHWLRERSSGWRASLALNLVGATATSAVLVIVLVTKFFVGAWIVLLIGPLLVWGMAAINRHYRAFAQAVQELGVAPQSRREINVAIIEDRVDAATAAAVAYAIAIGSDRVEGVLVPSGSRRANTRERWRTLAPDLDVAELAQGITTSPALSMRNAARELAAQRPDAFVVSMIPETRSDTWVDLARAHRGAQRAKAALVADGRTVVTNVVAPPGGDGPYQVIEPVQHHVVVLVNRVHTAAMRAIAYAQSLESTSIQALSVNVGGRRSGEILEAWQTLGVDMPLDIIDSPYRAVVDSVRHYLEDFEPDGQYAVVTVVMSEYVLPKPWQRSLHNTSVLQLKSALLFQRGVVITSVPTRLDVLPRVRLLRPRA
ncbi:APC family permease [Euzebya tangerina]|uniref:APC family permease n=1 Tax=Euzebya tangerina TaxID=591198 RepID=UPI000E3165CB|nr:APC family permease [Euzebya tangerina]